MKKIPLALLFTALSAFSITGNAASADRPTLKPGLWEFSYTTSMNGTSQTMKQKSCIAGPEAEEADEDDAYKNECKTTRTHTSNSWKETTVCKHSPTWSQTSENTITMQGDTAMTLKGSSTNIEDGKTIKMETTGTGKWSSKDCGNVKPGGDLFGR